MVPAPDEPVTAMIGFILYHLARNPELRRRVIAEPDLMQPVIEEVLRLITVQQGPGEVLVAMKVRVKSGLTTHEVVDSINRFEQAVHNRAPEIRWCFVEPDHEA